MKALINYVIQDAANHFHYSEIAEIPGPPHHCTPEVPVSEVIRWMEKKQNSLRGDQRIAIQSMYKF